ncbi:disease resistance protein RPV1-like [Cryptomeria japonica]|uniref:disease resistance protein RPV1-like n=1 Tax=Cryptomeria japonica TaxID=3369 RepID=UPI0027DA3CBA|nr:disease resistance protein RPV1-like [Cryptomeria japonica]
MYKLKIYMKHKKMFQDISGSNDIPFNNVEEGKAILAEQLRSVKVFIVLDDVHHLNQLESLLPVKDNLRHDSLIVITSRDFGLLTSWGIPYNSIYKVKELNFLHAMELFCWHAFPQPFEINEFEYLIKRFLEVCRGLPLSLKVLGGLVCGKSKEYWDAQLKEVSGLLPEDIRSILKVSFDLLCERDREVFLDISCFFIGTETDSTITVWDGCGWSGVCSLKRLVEKCLVEVDRRNYIIMYDQLRDLARQIAETRALHRLWSPQQITHIIEKQGEESVSIRGIKAQSDEFYEEFVELVRESVLPPWISLKKLRALEFREASKLEEPWSETGDISFYGKGAPIEGLPEQFCHLRSLEDLELVGCDKLKSLPSKFGDMINLRCLELTKCSGIEGLPEEFFRLQLLKSLKLERCYKLKSLPSKFGDLTNLRNLRIEKCYGLTIAYWGTLVQLTKISLEGIDDCPGLTELLGVLKIELCGELRRIEGLENCRSLEVLQAQNRRKEVIQSLKIIESLSWKWPERCMICCSAAPGVEAKLESFTFPGLTLA